MSRTRESEGRSALELCASPRACPVPADPKVRIGLSVENDAMTASTSTLPPAIEALQEPRHRGAQLVFVPVRFPGRRRLDAADAWV